MATKPTIADARWAELVDGTPAANLESPPSGVRDTGWELGKPGISRYENWQQREFYRWLKYLADGALAGNIGFYGAAAVAKPAATGPRGGNEALASLLTSLATVGLITDSTTSTGTALRLKTRMCAVDTTLGNDDAFAVFTAINVTITLPPAPPDGMVVFLHSRWSGGVIGRNGKLWNENTVNGALLAGQSLGAIYSTAGGSWYVMTGTTP